jgi:uncharacterized membrane protein YgcG
MGATAASLPAGLAVEPGGEAQATVRIRNIGSVVDQFTFEVVGDPGRWTRVEPPALSLFPGTEEDVQLVFAPLRQSSVTAGLTPYGLKVVSKEDPASTFVQEGEIDVAPFRDLTAELMPRASRGSLFARHRLALDNRGNVPVVAALSAVDDENRLGFRFSEPELSALPGTAAFAKLSIRPRKQFWRGPAITRPFKVLLAPEGAEPVAVDGSLVQEALLPKWLLPALAALAVLAIAWFALLRPAIDDQVDEAVAAQLGPQAGDGGGDNGSGSGSGSGNGSGSGPGGSGQSGSGGTDGGSGGAFVLFDKRLSCPGNAGSFDVPKDKQLEITDVVFGNPDGTTGKLTLRRDNSPLLVQQLANFRDLDFHFVTPIVVPGEQALVLDCSGSASAAVLVSGHLVNT